MEEEKKGLKWCVIYAAKLDESVGCTICTIAAASEGPDKFGISKQARMSDFLPNLSFP